jgi:hypothetical protein
LYEHSYLAWRERKGSDVAPVINKRKIWAIATGQDGDQWDDFIKNSHVSIGWHEMGNLDQYSTQKDIQEKLEDLKKGEQKPTNDAKCLFQFSKEIQIGDVVVAKSGRKQIKGAGIITSDYIYDDSKGDQPNIRIVKWMRTDATEFPDTGTAIKALTEISGYPDFKLFVEDYLNMHSIEPLSEEYGVKEIIEDGCFLSINELNKIIENLENKKNIIFQGPPGTGKTWLAKRIGYALIGSKNHDQLKAVQFHPNLSYEDFVRGWRPSADGKLSLIDGPFMEAITIAQNSTDPYVIIIEEINRGNPAQIFGEMLTLLEADKRIVEEGLELTYKRSISERVFIPSNLYVIGTMNVADRSLALVDLALRRRFAFINLSPNINNAWKTWMISKHYFSEELVNKIQEKLQTLNDQISKDKSLGPQYQIGQSYVTPALASNIDDKVGWFKQVIETEIYPLLSEYWFDNPDLAIKLKEELLSNLE